MSPYVLQSIYFAYFQSRLRWNCILGGSESKKVIQTQKMVIRIISGINKHESCRQIVKDYRILTVTSLYILEVLCYIKKYKGDLKQNLVIHGHNTKRKLDLHTYFCNTVIFQKSLVNMGIKLFNNLPERIQNWITSNFLKKY
jgi:hypothetical protein